MTPGKQPHILNASSNLLGICFILITGLKLAGASETTFASEIGIFASLCFLGSCLFSYLSIRTEKGSTKRELWADYLFLAGIFSLFIGVFVFAMDIL